MIPLIEAELWGAILKAKEENVYKPFHATILKIKKLGKSTEKLLLTVPRAYAKTSVCFPGDLILLTYFPDQEEGPFVPSPNMPRIFARVSKVSQDKTKLHVTIKKRNDFTVKYFIEGIKYHGLKVISLITAEREYFALNQVNTFSLAKKIYEAKPEYQINLKPSGVNKIMKKFGLNESQASAIHSATTGFGFKLIQGPPGTGKTKTILGILGTLLLKEKSKKGKRRLLVCAPSNAAIDELAGRLKDGIAVSGKMKLKPRIVRYGRQEAVTGPAKELTIEKLLNKELQTESINEAKKQIGKLARGVNQNSEEIKHVLRKIAKKCKCKKCVKSAAVDENTLKAQLEKLEKKSLTLGDQLHKLREKNSINVQRRDVASRSLIMDADIILSTLSSAGNHNLRSLKLKFETVIVDEAAQCVEPSLLIPLQYKTSRCILVGDPKQLPPTVFSKYASARNYQQSMFQRMYNKHSLASHMLNVQYRMHPDISEFPNEVFYGGKLHDGPENALKTTRSWHMGAHGLFSPFRFFNVVGEESQQESSKSYFNKNEAEFVYELYRFLRSTTKEPLAGKMGIISMYRGQVACIKEVFKQHLNEEEMEGIFFSTVDGFQGQEKDIIIVSCVRAGKQPGGGIGFLSAKRRMNVALTRAKAGMWVVGNRQTLQDSSIWGKLILSSVERGLISSAKMN